MLQYYLGNWTFRPPEWTHSTFPAYSVITKALIVCTAYTQYTDRARVRAHFYFQ